jgi:hypothetical protein
MPVITSCPDCGRKLRVPDDLLGRKVRCPGCKIPFTANAEPSEELLERPAPAITPPPNRPAPPPDLFSAGRPPLPPIDDEPSVNTGQQLASEFEEYAGGDASGSDREGWHRVRDGIGYILTGIWIVLGSSFGGVFAIMVVGLIGHSAATTSRGELSASGVGAMFGLAGVCYLLMLTGILVGLIFMLVGHAFCMVVPGGKGKGAFARGLSIGAFSCLATVYGAAVGSIVFLFFLWSMAHLILRPDVAAKIRTYLYALAFAQLGSIVMMSFALLISAVAGIHLLIFLVYFLWALASFGMFVWYIILLFTCRHAVNEYLSR